MDIQDIEFITEIVEGLISIYYDNLTITLDITITDDLEKEGFARELISKIQNKRKELKLNFNVIDRIDLFINNDYYLKSVLEQHENFIKNETLINNIIYSDNINEELKINDKFIQLNLIKSN